MGWLDGFYGGKQMNFKKWYSTHWYNADDGLSDADIKNIQEEAYKAGYTERQEQERNLHGRRKEDKNI